MTTIPIIGKVQQIASAASTERLLSRLPGAEVGRCTVIVEHATYDATIVGRSSSTTT